jgi:hypothetical protein
MVRGPWNNLEIEPNRSRGEDAIEGVERQDRNIEDIRLQDGERMPVFDQMDERARVFGGDVDDGWERRSGA